MRNLRSFLTIYRNDEFQERWRAVKEQILEEGSYDLTFEELQYGCNLAWRNEPRCPARIQWENLVRMVFCYTNQISCVFNMAILE